MKRIKFTSKTTLKLDNGNGLFIEYKGYNLGELPRRFAFKYRNDGIDEEGNDIIREGISQWFNYKGLTWVIAPKRIF